MSTYVNPVIPGYYPDPSVCRVGEDYYLVNSSFEFFPGVPLWHSRDLVKWEQLGHVLTRPSQLPLGKCRPSGGIFAPTIREHNGRFYMITTNINWMAEGSPNFIVSTDDIRGEWSEPVRIAHQGIDPSLFWDDDGTAYYCGTGLDAASGKQGIVCFALDTATGEILSEKKILWYGSGGRCPEGPHLYKIGGMYYLLIAEGGTEYGHMVTVARSESIWGPYESCPHNPILTHRDRDRSPLQAIGHSDLVTTPEGKWAIVFHGIRPTQSMLHHIGRETMVAPVEWEDGWPVVNGGNAIEPVMERFTEGPDARFENAFREEFSDAKPAPRWTFLRNPIPENYKFGDGLTLRGAIHTLDDLDAVTFLGVRQQQLELDYTTKIRLSGTGRAGLSVFHTAEHHYDLAVRAAGEGLGVTLRRRAVDLIAETEPVVFPGAKELVLKVVASRKRYTFFAGPDEAHLTEIGTGSTQLLSTEVMTGTFTGCFAALFAEGDVTAQFPYFTVEESPEQAEKNKTCIFSAFPV